MAVAITGASGLIGTALTASLNAEGTDVIRLVRRPATAPDEVSWDPAKRTVDTAALAERSITAVVHLAGAGVGDRRWNAEYRKLILSSRVDGTAAIAQSVAELPGNPVLISGSAIGYYGDTGTAIVDESGPLGDTFLAHVVRDWEAAADPARRAGRRVACIRTGLVADSEGGAFGKMIPIFRKGIGGRIGSGKQWWSFISIADEVGAIKFCIDNDIEGPVNLVAPKPVTNAEATKALAALLDKPAVLPVPKFALRVALGGFAQEVTMSQGVAPEVLTKAGFQWQHPTIEQALAAMQL